MIRAGCTKLINASSPCINGRRASMTITIPTNVWRDET